MAVPRTARRRCVNALVGLYRALPCGPYPPSECPIASRATATVLTPYGGIRVEGITGA